MEVEEDQTAELLNRIKELRRVEKTVLIALDGRYAAGKTILAAYLRSLTDCTVFHMDDFEHLREKASGKSVIFV